MQEMQQSSPAAAGMPSGAVVLTPSSNWSDADDYALGCECADPALQIERWGSEASQSMDMR